MPSLPLHLQHLPLTLQNILTNYDEVYLYLKEQLPNLNPQEKQDVLEHIFTHFPHLEKLNLSDNNLETLPSSIGNLTRLTRLYLGNNKLDRLPETFGNLTQLAYLGLGNNKLDRLPETFGNLTQLTQLELHENELDRLPEALGNLTLLIRLTLSDNHLTSLPKNFSNLTKLIRLDLSDNQLTDLPISIIKLPDNMKCNISNSSYPLTYNALSDDMDKHNCLTFLPTKWQKDYEDVFKPLKAFLKSILSLDEVTQAKTFFSYSSLSKECYHLIKRNPLVSEESNLNITAENSTKRIKCHQEEPSQEPAPNSSATSHPLPEDTPKFHYFTQLPNEISERILLHAATIPASHHPQFTKSFRKLLSDKPSFNSLTCFLEEVAPDWRKRVQQSYEEAQKTSMPYR